MEQDNKENNFAGTISAVKPQQATCGVFGFKANASYWSREVQEWLHRSVAWIWVSGAVPDGLNDGRPLVLDWSSDDLKSKEEARLLPANALLSDLRH